MMRCFKVISFSLSVLCIACAPQEKITFSKSLKVEWYSGSAVELHIFREINSKGEISCGGSEKQSEPCVVVETDQISRLRQELDQKNVQTTLRDALEHQSDRYWIETPRLIITLDGSLSDGVVLPVSSKMARSNMLPFLETLDAIVASKCGNSCTISIKELVLRAKQRA